MATQVENAIAVTTQSRDTAMETEDDEVPSLKDPKQRADIGAMDIDNTDQGYCSQEKGSQDIENNNTETVPQKYKDISTESVDSGVGEPGKNDAPSLSPIRGDISKGSSCSSLKQAKVNMKGTSSTKDVSMEEDMEIPTSTVASTTGKSPATTTVAMATSKSITTSTVTMVTSKSPISSSVARTTTTSSSPPTTATTTRVNTQGNVSIIIKNQNSKTGSPPKTLLTVQPAQRAAGSASDEKEEEEKKEEDKVKENSNIPAKGKQVYVLKQGCNQLRTLDLARQLKVLQTKQGQVVKSLGGKMVTSYIQPQAESSEGKPVAKVIHVVKCIKVKGPNGETLLKPISVSATSSASATATSTSSSTSTAGSATVSTSTTTASTSTAKGVISTIPIAPSQSSSPTKEEDIEITLDMFKKLVKNFVELYEKLDTQNDRNTKPSYSYTELIFMSILRSPIYCLTIHEIYRYIEKKFQFYRRRTNQNWRNAVRHSLSRTHCFQKVRGMEMKDV